jgi:hypothetical protein
VEQKRWGLPPLACRFAKALPHCSQVGDDSPAGFSGLTCGAGECIFIIAH